MEGRMDGWRDGWMDAWMDELIYVCMRLPPRPSTPHSRPS